MPLDVTEHFQLPLPHPDNNPRDEDVPRLRQALTIIDTRLAEGATQADITAAIDALKGSAPAAYDTLVEIAVKLEDNDDVVAGMLTALGLKASSAEVAAAINAEATARNAAIAAAVSAAVTPATNAQAYAGTAGKLIDAAVARSALAPVTVAFASPLTLDFAAARNFMVTLAGNATIANPANRAPGQSGVIVFKQDATGGRAPVWGSAWTFAGGAPVLTQTAGAVDIVAYWVEAVDAIRCTASLGFV